MCGISGFFSRNGEPVPRDLIVSMTRILSHRGPDDEGIFINDFFSFGHRRLSIIDVNGGAQPMFNEDNSIVVMFNGEVYNYKELREELISKGHRFSSFSDTEVIVHLYEERGNEVFSQLNGMFAIAIADLKARKLLLARDRLGEKPLFYYADKNWVVFASEIKSIVLHPAIQRELNHSALYDYLSLNYIPGNRTMLKNIKRVLPGCLMAFGQEDAQESAYWSISSFRRKNYEPSQEDEAIEELDSLLTESVRIRLRSDVPIGIFLSGGVDSSLVAWKARELGAEVCAYTASFGEKSFSEDMYAREIAGLLDMGIEVFEITPDVEKVFYSLVYHADEPMADSSSLPVFLLSKHTSQHVKVVLGGDGGDEVFGGYLTYPATLLAKRIRKYIPLSFIKLNYSIANGLPVSDRKVSLEYKWKRFLRGLRMPSGAAHFSWNGTWCKSEKDNLLSDDFLLKVKDCEDTFEYLMSKYEIERDDPDLQSLQMADICEYLPNDILAKVDRMSMAHGLEVRAPWLDHRIVEWGLMLPPDLKLRRNKLTKYLLKRYMTKKFPSHLANRPKQGFSIPINKWIRKNLWEMVEEFLSKRMLDELGIFHTGNVRNMLEAHRRGKSSFGFEIWGLLVFMVWNKNFFEGMSQ